MSNAAGGLENTTTNIGDAVEVEEEEVEGLVLPGFRFHPTDEELVGFYLRRKVEKKPLTMEIIRQIDIYKYDPWDLPKISTIGDKEWYFFCLRGRKYRNSIRPNRVTGSGFWKATGIDRPIYSPSSAGGHRHNHNNNNYDCIGLKKSLVYYRGSAGKGTKTDWMMHEFRLPSSSSGGGKNNCVDDDTIREAEDLTICRIFKRKVTYKKYAQDSSSKHIPVADSTSTTSKTCSTTESDSTRTGDDHHPHKQQHLYHHHYYYSAADSGVIAPKGDHLPLMTSNHHLQDESSSQQSCTHNEGSIRQWELPSAQVSFPASPFSTSNYPSLDELLYGDGDGDGDGGRRIWDELGSRLIDLAAADNNTPLDDFVHGCPYLVS